MISHDRMQTVNTVADNSAFVRYTDPDWGSAATLNALASSEF